MAILNSYVSLPEGIVYIHILQMYMHRPWQLACWTTRHIMSLTHPQLRDCIKNAELMVVVADLPNVMPVPPKKKVKPVAFQMDPSRHHHVYQNHRPIVLFLFRFCCRWNRTEIKMSNISVCVFKWLNPGWFQIIFPFMYSHVSWSPNLQPWFFFRGYDSSK